MESVHLLRKSYAFDENTSFIKILTFKMFVWIRNFSGVMFNTFTSRIFGRNSLTKSLISCVCFSADFGISPGGGLGLPSNRSPIEASFFQLLVCFAVSRLAGLHTLLSSDGPSVGGVGGSYNYM